MKTSNRSAQRIFLFSSLGIAALVAGCAGQSAENEQTTGSAVTRGNKCSSEIGATYAGAATVTADNSGVQCFDKSGAYVASVAGSVGGKTSTVQVVGSSKLTFSGKSGNFLEVHGQTAAGGAVDCWMSANYLCATTAVADAGSAVSTPAASDSTANDHAAVETARACFVDEPNGHLTFGGVADAASACCHTRLELASQVGTCVGWVQHCLTLSESEGQRACPTDTGSVTPPPAAQPATNDHAAVETARACFIDDPSVYLTFGGLADAASTCCHTRLELASQVGTCLDWVQHCLAVSEAGDGQRSCPTDTASH